MHEVNPLIWDLLLLLVVIAFGPFLAERLRLPGIIGLLLGGFLIGPTGLGLLKSGAELEAFGHIGLLYLMFLAGLELDLNVFAKLKRAAITFGLLTFVLPLLAGTAMARLLGFDWPAAILIGSLWASHTLVTYPIVQRYGLTADPAVATTVGATVITDTLALLVLAVVAGGQSEGGGNFALVLVGLGALVLYCTFVLTFLTRWFFSGLGQDRALRFVFIVAAFLSAAVVAEIGGIEGIVGAFFAGLALNRFVPNGGPLMERTEFFGSALFIPAFLVSVGLLIDPAVLLAPYTWVLAAAFTVALVAGKGGAAWVIGRMRGFSRPQVTLVFSLSLAQAAATLAATTVGADIGLFGQDVVNAVVVVIVISLFASSLLASKAAPRVAPPSREGRPIGSVVLAPIEEPSVAGRVAGLAERIAQRDAGNVIPVHLVADGEDHRTLEEARAESKAIDDAFRKAGVEAEPSLRVAGSVRQGVRNEISENEASLLVLARHGALRPQDFIFGGTSEEILAVSPIPALIVELDETAPPERVLLPLRTSDLGADNVPTTRLAVLIANRLEASGLELVVGASGTLPADLGLTGDHDLTGLSGGRMRWIREIAKPGDVVILPGGTTGVAFGVDAARVASMPGVSVGVVSGPFRQQGFPVGRDMSAAVVSRTA